MASLESDTYTQLNPEGWAPARGYSNGISVRGRAIYVAGQVGWDPADCKFKVFTLVEQLKQALINVSAVLTEAGAGPENLVRMTWFITSKKDYTQAQRDIGQAYREVLGRNFPTMSVVFVSDLVEDEALIEIEATAMIPDK